MMKCPICNVDLLMATRKEVEIDYCPKCRGIWLDRGELDKIIERSANEIMPENNNSYGRGNNEHDRDDDDDDHRGGHRDDDNYVRNDRGYQNQGNPNNRRKRNFLGDLFDF
jgi:Zn-finger nucleic acid-binding protein